jgi:hypothetical protein
VTVVRRDGTAGAPAAAVAARRAIDTNAQAMDRMCARRTDMVV